MNSIAIRDIRVFVTAPRGVNLVIVRAEMSEPEFFRYGYATFIWRHKAMITAIEGYPYPVLKGRSVHSVRDVWQAVMGNSY